MSPKLWPTSVSALLLVVFFLGGGAETQAQSSTGAASPAPLVASGAGGPADPRAAVPPVQHRSAFVGYRALGAAEPADWRTANDRVARIGGWRAYTREAHAPVPAPAPAAAAASAPSASSARPTEPLPASNRPQGAHSHGGH